MKNSDVEKTFNTMLDLSKDIHNTNFYDGQHAVFINTVYHFIELHPENIFTSNKTRNLFSEIFRCNDIYNRTNNQTDRNQIFVNALNLCKECKGFNPYNTDDEEFEKETIKNLETSKTILGVTEDFEEDNTKKKKNVLSRLFKRGA